MTLQRIMTETKHTPAPRGRERTCTQCGATYRSPRRSKYCSVACRKKANRGTAPTGGPKAGPAGFTPITKALLKVRYVGCLGSTGKGGEDGPVFGLLVPHEHALQELSFQFNRKGFGHVSREEFTGALRRDNIQGYASRSTESAERKRWQDRQRQRETRSS